MPSLVFLTKAISSGWALMSRAAVGAEMLDVLVPRRPQVRGVFGLLGKLPQRLGSHVGDGGDAGMIKKHRPQQNREGVGVTNMAEDFAHVGRGSRLY